MHIFKKKPKSKYVSRPVNKTDAAGNEKDKKDAATVTKNIKSKKFDAEKYVADLKKQHHSSNLKKENLGIYGFWVSVFTMLSGAGSSGCTKAASNPIVIGAGAILGIISLGYMIWKYFN